MDFLQTQVHIRIPHTDHITPRGAPQRDSWAPSSLLWEQAWQPRFLRFYLQAPGCDTMGGISGCPSGMLVLGYLVPVPATQPGWVRTSDLAAENAGTLGKRLSDTNTHL